MTCFVFFTVGSTISFPGWPFILRFMLSLTFGQYGFLAEDNWMVYYSVCSAGLYLICCIIFTLYDHKWAVFMQQFLGGLAFVVLSAAYIYLFGDEENKIRSAAFQVVIWIMLTYVTPVIVMTDSSRRLEAHSVLKTDSVSQICVTSAAWIIYGIFREKLFLILPSTFGLIVAAVKYSIQGTSRGSRPKFTLRGVMDRYLLRQLE